MIAAASLDTNVLLRLIVQDDKLQLATAKKALSQYSGRSQTLFVPVTVTLELEWVLRSRYQFAKADFSRTLNALLATVELEFEGEAALEQAIATYEGSPSDFPDCLHLALSRQAEALPFLTFDARASRVSGAKLLK